MGGHAFISYSRTDKAYVEKLANDLKANGLEVWYDEEIATGGRFPTVIQGKIDECSAFIVVMTPAARDSHWVEAEVNHALHIGAPVRPLLLAGKAFFEIGAVNYEDVTDGRLPAGKFVDDLRELQAAPLQRKPRRRPWSRRQVLTVVSLTGAATVVAGASYIASRLATASPGHGDSLGSSPDPTGRSPSGAAPDPGGSANPSATPGASTGPGANGVPGAGAPGAGGTPGATTPPGTGGTPSASGTEPTGSGGGGQTTAGGATASTTPATATVLRVINAHSSAEGGVFGVAWSAQGLLASAGEDSTVRIWNPDSGAKVFGDLTGHTRGVRAVAWSPGGDRLVSGDVDGMVRVWRGSDGAFTTSMAHGSSVLTLAWTPDGGRVASAGLGGTARLWRTDTWAPPAGRNTFTADAVAVWGAAWSPDSQYLLTGGSDHSGKIWSAGSDNPLYFINESSNSLNGVAWEPGGTRAAVATSNRDVWLWDLATAQTLIPRLSGHTGQVMAVAWSPARTRLVSTGNDRTIVVWDPDLREPIGGPLSGHTDDWIRTVAWSPDGTRFATGGGDGKVIIWGLNR